MRGQIAKGAAWMVLFRLFDRSIGLVSTAVLARLLIPGDFGLVAMAMSVIVLIELATAFGFEMSLIQMSTPRREHFDTAWSLNLSIAFGGALVTAAAAYPAAAFYGDARLAPVIVAIGAVWLIEGFQNIGTVNFRRDLNFAAEFRWMASKRLIAFVVTMIAALTLRNYWALVIGAAAGRISGVALSYVMHPFRPRFTYRYARDLFSFSGWLLVNHALGVVVSRIPHFFVGRLFGAQALGAYTVAAEISQLAHTELISPINRAMFPGYSRLKTDPPLFRKTCVDATAVILLIALPVSVGIGVLAGPFVRLLLGAQWGEAVPIIQVLAVAGAVSALTSNNLSIYLALGRPYLPTAAMAARVIVMIAVLALVNNSLGAIGVAWAELIAAVASLAVSLPTLFIAVGISVRKYASVFWRPAAASALMGWAVHAAVRPSFDVMHLGSAVGELLLGVLIGALVYPLAVAFLWWLGGTSDSVEVQITRRMWAELGGRWTARRAD